MKLNLGRTFMLTLAVGGAMLTGPAQAQAQTYLYIAHAASGRNVSATANPAMPVDVSVNSNCIEKGLSFGDINGPFTGPAGTFTFKVTMANTVNLLNANGVIVARPDGAVGAATYHVWDLYQNHLGPVALSADVRSPGRLTAVRQGDERDRRGEFRSLSNKRETDLLKLGTIFVERKPHAKPGNRL